MDSMVNSMVSRVDSRNRVELWTQLWTSDWTSDSGLNCGLDSRLDSGLDTELDTLERPVLTWQVWRTFLTTRQESFLDSLLDIQEGWLVYLLGRVRALG